MIFQMGEPYKDKTRNSSSFPFLLQLLYILLQIAFFCNFIKFPRLSNKVLKLLWQDLYSLVWMVLLIKIICFQFGLSWPVNPITLFSPLFEDQWVLHLFSRPHLLFAELLHFLQDCAWEVALAEHKTRKWCNLNLSRQGTGGETPETINARNLIISDKVTIVKSIQVIIILKYAVWLRI